ncbi:hypothetical protein KXX05_008894 [Aspergillus fumigatus]|nr:hypothetical protein KXX05_008894 [Aspergillus fumigatus]
MRDEDDPQTQPCIIRWDPMTDAFGQPGIMLVRSNRDFTEDLQPVQVDSSHLRAKSVHPREVSTTDPGFKELYPGSSVSWELDLPSVYFNSLRPGERYRILWPQEPPSDPTGRATPVTEDSRGGKRYRRSGPVAAFSRAYFSIWQGERRSSFQPHHRRTCHAIDERSQFTGAAALSSHNDTVV